MCVKFCNPMICTFYLSVLIQTVGSGLLTVIFLTALLECMLFECLLIGIHGEAGIKRTKVVDYLLFAY